MNSCWLRTGAMVVTWALTDWVSAAQAQVPASVSVQVPGGCETPVTERTSEIGCYTTAAESLGTLPEGPLYWHLYQYPSRPAAEAAKGLHGTIVESLGKIWLYTIAESSWRAPEGERIAVVGPLRIRAGTQYTARYLEAVFPPDMESRNLVHRHSGPEAWYLVTGAQCLETPEGATVLRAGQSGVVPEGPPMSLTVVGTETRRSVVLVLYDTSQPWTTMASDWQPKGLCPK